MCGNGPHGLDGLAEREGPAVSAAYAPTSAAELADALCALLDWMSSSSRTATTARLVLFMEASHDVSLRESLSRARVALARMLTVATAGLSARNPDAFVIAARFEGLLLHRIARHDQTDPRPTLDSVVWGALNY